MDIKIEVENRLSRREILGDIVEGIDKVFFPPPPPPRNPFGFPMDTAARLQKILKALVLGPLEVVGDTGKRNTIKTVFMAMLLYPLVAVSAYLFLIVYFIDQTLINIRNTPIN